MEITIKAFDELSTDELYALLRLRAEIFVVEQTCPYQDLDGKDQGALHVCLYDGSRLVAYLRVLARGVRYPEVCISRVVTAEHGRGWGRLLMQAGMRAAVERFGADAIRISAQCQAIPFYQKQGFAVVSGEYLEDDIPHVEMLWRA